LNVEGGSLGSSVCARLKGITLGRLEAQGGGLGCVVGGGGLPGGEGVGCCASFSLEGSGGLSARPDMAEG
jgi:hypothetical protein